MSAFELLHPAVQHHIVNSLGWRTLRPLQEATIEPILAGDHVLAMAPTAGGKTESAVFPVLSQILTENRRGLSVLYVCPLRALLNNLHVRLGGYAQLLGRSVGLWHGDVSAAQRDRLLADPPDILLTTPESLEAMLVSTRVEHRRWFASLRTVIVDEAHAFAADDRGWHLLAVLARLSHLAGREIQRIALSATIGNPTDVLDWLTVGCTRPRHVINPPAPPAAPPEITLDYVGDLDNAALVISRMHRGEKRLVFVDSRARAEQLAAELRSHDVVTFVSHGSLGLDERRRAEEAFAEARDCVIVSTSTLELGIDVGDLDHVLQIDSTNTVASLLQRLGRTGRRAGTVRNMTMLATSEDALLKGAAVLLRWGEGFVEPTVAPALPMHLIGQQVLALTLQEGMLGRHTLREWFGDPFVLGGVAGNAFDEVLDHLVAEGFLVDVGNGMLAVGGAAEEAFGHRHFMELLAAFTAPPLFSVRHGRLEIGLVSDDVLFARAPGGPSGPVVLLLAGRHWKVLEIDWKRRIISVEPTDTGGKARWKGDGMALGGHVSRGIREVLCGRDPSGVEISRRARERLAALREEFAWLRPNSTALVTAINGTRTWWTFAGGKANLWLAELLSSLRTGIAQIDDLTVSLDPGADVMELRRLLSEVDPPLLDLSAWVSQDAVDRLKFSDTLPNARAVQEVTARLRDDAGVTHTGNEPVIEIVGS